MPSDDTKAGDLNYADTLYNTSRYAAALKLARLNLAHHCIPNLTPRNSVSFRTDLHSPYAR